MTATPLKRSRGTYFTVAVIFELFRTVACGQSFSTTINVPPDAAPSLITSNTSLNVRDGAIFRTDFQAGTSSTLSTNIEVNVTGGIFTKDFLAERGSTVNVTAGQFINYFRTRAGSIVNFSGGQVVLRALLGENAGPTSASPSVVNISGGSIDQTTIWENADVSFSGGDFGVVSALSGSQVSISGGRFSQGYQAAAGSKTEIRGGVIPRGLFLAAGSAVTLCGGEFLLDGVPVSGMVNVPEGSVLTGTMMDGTSFVFSTLNGDSIAPGTLQINEFPLPPATRTEIHLSNHHDQSPVSLRAGQTLTVSGLGGTGRYFTAVDAHLVVDGGFVESGSEFVRSDVDINSGFVNDGFNAFAGSSVRIRGGQVQDGFRAYVGSEVHVIGTEFKLADPVTGAIISDLTPTLIFGEAQVLHERDLALVVRLADGTYFDLNKMRGDYVDVDATLTITLIPEPTSLALLLSMIAALTFAATSHRARRSVRFLSVATVNSPDLFTPICDQPIVVNRQSTVLTHVFWHTKSVPENVGS